MEVPTVNKTTSGKASMEKNPDPEVTLAASEIVGFSQDEERRLIRKIDWRIMAWAAISFSALNIDRGNLSQANSDHFLPDLGMNTNGIPFLPCAFSRGLIRIF